MDCVSVPRSRRVSKRVLKMYFRTVSFRFPKPSCITQSSDAVNWRLKLRGNSRRRNVGRGTRDWVIKSRVFYFCPQGYPGQKGDKGDKGESVSDLNPTLFTIHCGDALNYRATDEFRRQRETSRTSSALVCLTEFGNLPAKLLTWRLFRR